VSDSLSIPPPAIQRIAMLSMHTSPLAPLGGSKSGGMNFAVLRAVEELAAQNLFVDVFTRRDSEVAPEVASLSSHARVIVVPAGPSMPLDPEALPAHVEEFAAGVEVFRQRERLRYDLVHAHYWLSAEAGELLAGRWAVPHLVTFHTLGEVKLRARASERESPERLAAERRLVHAASRVVASTVHERQLLRQLYRVPPERVAVVSLGVDLEEFQPRDPAEARESLGLDPAGRVLLAVGRIEPLKGFDILIRALAQMTLDEPVSLLVVGGDERASAEFERLRAVAHEVGVTNRVHFVGSVPHDRLPGYYNAADVVCVPSFYESFGLVALEAMASGVPVVASRVGGLVATVRDGRTGYLVPWRCPEPFAEKLDLLLRNEPLRQSLGRAARDAMAAYDWERVTAELRALYEDEARRLESTPGRTAATA